MHITLEASYFPLPSVLAKCRVWREAWRSDAPCRDGGAGDGARRARRAATQPAPEGAAQELGEARGGDTGQRAEGARGPATPRPRNPRHFDGIGGGRKRVSDMLLIKRV